MGSNPESCVQPALNECFALLASVGVLNYGASPGSCRLADAKAAGHAARLPVPSPNSASKKCGHEFRAELHRVRPRRPR